MATFALSLPVFSTPLATAPADALVRYRRRALAQGHKSVTLGRRYVLGRAYMAFYTLASAVIPDDAYDWEDENVADFLEEDLNL
jgi:hypothetical protein